MAIEVIDKIERKNNPSAPVTDADKVAYDHNTYTTVQEALDGLATPPVAPFRVVEGSGAQTQYATWADAVAGLTTGSTLYVATTPVSVDVLPTVSCTVIGDSTDFQLSVDVLVTNSLVWAIRNLDGSGHLVSFDTDANLTLRTGNILNTNFALSSGDVHLILMQATASSCNAVINAGRVELINSSWSSGSSTAFESDSGGGQVTAKNSAIQGLISNVAVTVEAGDSFTGDPDAETELDNPANWSAGEYTGPPLPSFIDGKRWASANYIYISFGGMPVRLARV